ncbi:MAG: bifunctional 3,4-dihydroxy-2-butanone-4-phosphate synthase/GTP cyclohydrolase II, partial [Verrucomicrobia bacterium]|nr:bifunctional 3,4-dihydroxy-2-butanone-4-phosphate synthase/GTP cyclohydrolase II [Verrucomicrobiota bacterium]
MSRRPSGADPIEQVIAAMRAGRMVIMTDDAGRENEGDLVLAARRVTPALINFMAKEGRGLI